MSTTYTGSSNLTTSITIPSDGDLANALSVNVSSKALVDMEVYLLQTYGQVMQSTCPIRIYTPSSSSILIKPIPLVIVNEAGVWKSTFTTTDTTITVAQLEGGGTFTPLAWYYIYAYLVAGVCNFQISSIVPDQYSLYKSDGSFTYKYLASFKAFDATNMVEFSRYGDYTQYAVASNIYLSTFKSTQQTTASNSWIPPYKTTPTLTKLQYNITKTTTGVDTLAFISVSGTTGTVVSLYQATFSGVMECITDSSQIIYVKNNITNANNIAINLAGYYE